jgi:STE24 endopeptidase
VFNRFVPLPDERMAADLRALADRAGVPVREVLVADASRRTRKGNAYVSGLGRTRRVVVFDTLLARSSPEELAVVVAHELGHRRLRHVVRRTALGMAGAVASVAVLWALLRSGALLLAVGASGAGDPPVVPFVLLAVTVLEIVAIPVGAALSRRWESAADRFSLDVTRDPPAFEAAHRHLAVANLIDLDPPGWVSRLLLTHPTPPERIASARAWRG